MRSSAGAHYLALDHVRAFAAFMVFSWHFLHLTPGSVPYSVAPPLVFSLFEEGHTGVAVFMTLSGYLFAKLLDGRAVSYPAFFWNRFLRLFPLLALVMLLVTLRRLWGHTDWHEHFSMLLAGLLLPTWPNGGWSITVEAHFYALLPFLLAAYRRDARALVVLVASMVAVRAFLHAELGEVQSLAYSTIVGRIDQFCMGMLAFHHRGKLRGRHGVALAILLSWCAVYWWFNATGGYQGVDGFPSRRRIWIAMPLLEGMAYAALIAYYDASFAPPPTGASRFLGRIGTYSYSIYLLHFFVVGKMAAFIHAHVMPISNFYVAFAWAFPAFLLMIPIGYVSFRFFESPFLRARRPYVRD
jgi:peptidoglycan/LPS O-acetylase OafA/YrhL